MDMACDDISAGGASPSQVQAFASRNLDFLQLIEKTISRLTSDADFLRVQTNDIRKVVHGLSKVTSSPEIDPEGRVAELLRMAGDVTHRLYARVTKQRASAASDKALKDDDGVVEAFDDMLDALAGYFDALQTMCDAVQTLSATRSPVIGRFTNTKDLFDALDA